MMTAESMLSKRRVLRVGAVLFFLFKLFSSHICCIWNFQFVFTSAAGGWPLFFDNN